MSRRTPSGCRCFELRAPISFASCTACRAGRRLDTCPVCQYYPVSSMLGVSRKSVHLDLAAGFGDTEASGAVCACLEAVCEQQPPAKAEPDCAAACFTWAWIDDELACDNDDDAVDNCVYYAMLWCTNGQKGTWPKQPPGGCGGAAHTFTACEQECGDKWMRNADSQDNDGTQYGDCMQGCETSRASVA